MAPPTSLLRSSRGETGHLRLSFAPSVDARGLSPWLTLTFAVHIDLCSYGSAVFLGAAGAPHPHPPHPPRPVRVATRLASGSGSEPGTRNPVGEGEIHYLSRYVSVAILAAPLFPPSLSLGPPRPALRPHAALRPVAFVILGIGELKSLLMSDDPGTSCSL